MNNLSLSSLLLNLVNRAPKPSRTQDDEPKSSKKVGTTIRFDPNTRLFIEEQAEHLGISVQEFVAMTFKAIMAATEEPQATELELMADRFVQAFTIHGVPNADIPALLPEGTITRSDLLTRNNLLDKLDNATIQHVADLFSLNPDWLKGIENNPGKPGLYWYKNVSEVARHLANLKRTHRRVRVLFVSQKGLTMDMLRAAQKEGDSLPPIEIGLIIEAEGQLNNVAYTSYEFWDSERWNYWRCRYCLKSIMMFCEKSRIAYDGILLDSHAAKPLFAGTGIPAEAMKASREFWYPEVLVAEGSTNPELNELPSIKEFYQKTHAMQYETD